MREILTHSTITCPHCGEAREMEMPMDASQLFYKCPSCNVLISPKPEYGCVFCSYGSVPCPSAQRGLCCIEKG